MGMAMGLRVSLIAVVDRQAVTRRIRSDGCRWDGDADDIDLASRRGDTALP